MKGVTTHIHNTLSIRISTNGFCFCSYNATEPDGLLYHFHKADTGRTIAANFAEAWEGCPFAATGRYSAVQAIVATRNFTIVPAEYDNKEEQETMFRSCFPHIADTAIVASNSLPAYGTTILFPVDNELHAQLCRIGDVSYFSSASIMLGYIARRQFEEHRFIIAYCHNDNSLIISICDGKLLLANEFTSEHISDHLFYLLTVWKEQGLSQTDDMLYLCGDNSVEELTPLASKFIAHTKRINPTNEFRSHLLNNIKDIPFDLQTLLLCE